MRVLLDVEIVIMIDLVIRVINKTIGVSLILTLIRVVRQPILIVFNRVSVVGERLEFKLGMAHPWVLMIVNIMDLVSIVQIKLRMVILVSEGFKHVESPVLLRMSGELVEFALAIVMGSEL